MRKITIGTTYYNNPEDIQVFIRKHLPHVDELIVVDDGSQVFPIETYFKPTQKLRLFKVPTDYGFNSHGCRNLIVNQSTNDWIILLDSDRYFIQPKIDLDKIKKATINPLTVYKFYCNWPEHPEFKLLPENVVSVNDFLIHKDHYLSVGGYDEELVSVRAGDREFLAQLSNYGDERFMHEISLEMTRYSTKWHTERNKEKFIMSSRDTKEVPTHLQKLLNERIRNPDPQKPTLNFEWYEILN